MMKWKDTIDIGVYTHKLLISECSIYAATRCLLRSLKSWNGKNIQVNKGKDGEGFTNSCECMWTLVNLSYSNRVSGARNNTRSSEIRRAANAASTDCKWRIGLARGRKSLDAFRPNIFTWLNSRCFSINKIYERNPTENNTKDDLSFICVWRINRQIIG